MAVVTLTTEELSEFLIKFTIAFMEQIKDNTCKKCSCEDTCPDMNYFWYIKVDKYIALEEKSANKEDIREILVKNLKEFMDYDPDWIKETRNGKGFNIEKECEAGIPLWKAVSLLEKFDKLTISPGKPECRISKDFAPDAWTRDDEHYISVGYILPDEYLWVKGSTYRKCREAGMEDVRKLQEWKRKIESR